MVYFNKDGTKKIDTPPVWNTYRIQIYNQEQKQFKSVKNEPLINVTNSFIKNLNADNRLYYFRFIFKNKVYYKLGITSQTLKERYGSEYKKIDKILYDEKIDGTIKIEKELKNQYKDDIFPLKYFNDSGHTEIFDKDILNLDINLAILNI